MKTEWLRNGETKRKRGLKRRGQAATSGDRVACCCLLATSSSDFHLLSLASPPRRGVHQVVVIPTGFMRIGGRPELSEISSGDGGIVIVLL